MPKKHPRPLSASNASLNNLTSCAGGGVHNLPSHHVPSTSVSEAAVVGIRRRQQQQQQQQPLPSGWDVGQDFDGKIYFIDHNTKKTTWVDPREQQQQNVGARYREKTTGPASLKSLYNKNCSPYSKFPTKLECENALPTDADVYLLLSG